MDRPHTILDLGTCNTRIGYGGEGAEQPLVFPTLVGEVKSECLQMPMPGKQTHFAGNQVLAKNIRAMLAIKNPMEKSSRGRFDSDALRQLIDYGFDRLDERDTARRLVLIEPTDVTKQEREDLVDFIFNTGGVSELWMASAPACSLFASGRTTGVVLEAGEANAHVVPFLEGHALARGRWVSSKLAGRDVTADLKALLQKNNRLELREELPNHLLQLIKEKHSYISLNKADDEYRADNDPQSLQRFEELPDGRVMELSDERFRCGEIFFNPTANISRGGSTASKTRGIHHIISYCITRCDERLQPKLFNNLVLSGGVTLARGFHARLQKEINVWLNGCEEGMEVKARCKFTKAIQPVTRNDKCVVNHNDRTVCIQTWQGAAVLSRLSSFDALKVTATDVKENGPACVHRKQMAPARKEA